MSDIEQKGQSQAFGAQAYNNATNGQTAAFNPYAPQPKRAANPGALGLFSFASTTFILSMYNVQARHITVPNVVVGMAAFCGGLAQLLAGMWEFPRGNVFGGTAFTSYGAFWMSYAAILIPSFGVADAYAAAPDQISSAIGIYLCAWMIVTFFFFIVSLRKNIAFIALFFCLTLTFGLLAGANLSATHATSLAKAGGGVGILTAFIAYYVGLSELLGAEDDKIFGLPLGMLGRQNV